jgi:hypothetical protein
MMGGLRSSSTRWIVREEEEVLGTGERNSLVGFRCHVYLRKCMNGSDHATSGDLRILHCANASSDFRVCLQALIIPYLRDRRFRVSLADFKHSSSPPDRPLCTLADAATRQCPYCYNYKS